MREQEGVQTDFGKRRFLKRALVSAAAAVAIQSGFKMAAGSKPDAALNLGPDGALEQLREGNQRFAANQLTSINDDLALLKERTADKQEPFAAVLACADSRVPVELIFDQTIGRIFVTRVAGNVATPEIIGSLEYGVAVLGVKSLLVLGHTNCGAVKAAMKADEVPGQISVLYRHLQPAVAGSGGDVSKAIELNAKDQADLLRGSSTVIRDALKAGKLRVDAAVYDLATGKVTLV